MTDKKFFLKLFSITFSCLLCLGFTVLSVTCGLYGDIEEIRPALVGITITSYPEKDSYSIGEYIDLFGLEVRAIYNSGSRMAIENYSYTGFDSNTPGSKTITVEYQAFSAEFTVLVKHSSLLPLTDVSLVIPYLEEFSDSGNSADEPVLLPMQIDLGTMNTSYSGWRLLLEAIEEADKFVNLDLSACDMNGVQFDPVSDIITGKNKIVSLILPDAAKVIIAGNEINSSFHGFSVLEFVSGTNIEDIGAYSFGGSAALTDVNFPAAKNIGTFAFRSCTSLKEVNIPSIIIIGTNAFASTGTTALTINLGLTAPASLGLNIFSSVTAKTVTAQVPIGAVGYDNSWAKSFRGVNGSSSFKIQVKEESMFLLNIIYNVEPYLREQSGGITPDDPISLSMQIDLGLMEQSNSGWGELLNAIKDADKYVALDLSTCDVITYGFNSEHFDPNRNLTNGKDKIVSLVLPEVSKYIEGRFAEETYTGFNNLRFISGANIETINQFAFYKLESLKEVSFPIVTTIRNNAFEKCTSLEKVYLPAAEYIDWQAFVDNTSLTEVFIPNIKKMEDNVFSYTGNTDLTIIMGQTAPVVAYGSTFHDIDQPQRTVTVKVPNEAIGYDENWLFWFKKGNENITLIIEHKED